MSKKQAQEQLAALGLDPNLFNDPEFSDDDGEMDEEDYIKSFDVKVPKYKPIDVSEFISSNENDDIHVELDEEDLDENSDLNKALLAMTQDNEEEEEDNPQKQLEKLEKDLLEAKRTAVFFKQQECMEEARQQLGEIKRITNEINLLKQKIASSMPKDENTSENTSNDAIPIYNPPNPNKNSPKVQKITEEVHLNTGNSKSASLYGTQSVNYNSIIVPGSSMLQPESNPSSTQKIEPIQLDFQSLSISCESLPDSEHSVSNSKDHSENEESTTQLDLITETSSRVSIEIHEEENSMDLEQKLKLCESKKEECLKRAMELISDKMAALLWLQFAKNVESAIEKLKANEDVG